MASTRRQRRSSADNSMQFINSELDDTSTIDKRFIDENIGMFSHS